MAALAKNIDEQNTDYLGKNTNLELELDAHIYRIFCSDGKTIKNALYA